ncbi:MAG: SusC/RagA family TonB-linked outer membrane protein [Bacteroidales bacterium]|nr:SusC/RagA family TonB-linked outer membrane protein [Bacteroidales bacterium]
MKKCLSTLLFFVLALLLCSTAFAQKTFKVSGTVTDENGDPIPGVSIICQANKQGAITDAKGRYSINAASSTTTLQFSFLGYKTQDVKISGRAVIDIVLEEDAESLEAAVSIGYGLIQKRDDFTGSAVQVTKEQIAMRPADRIDNLLVGSVAGMNVIEESDGGRSSVKIRIRGDGSLSASNEPLWIIDGVPMYQGSRTNSVTGTSYTVSPLSYMNPDDIESITVLKDASTTTLYGADGSNGVILVTTRNARSGQMSYNASVRYGISAVDKSTLVKRTNGPQYLELAKEAWLNHGGTLATFPYQDNEFQTFSDVDFNWYDAYMGVGQNFQANFSAAGGSDKMKMMVSGGYYNSSSYVKGNNKKRYSISSKADIAFSPKFSLQVKLSADYNIDDLFSAYSFYDTYIPIISAYNPDGTYRLYNYYSKKDDGTYEVTQYKNNGNDLPEREYDENRQYNLNAEASGILTYKPFNWLSITSHTSEKIISIYESTYSSRKTLDGMNTSDPSLSGYSRRSGVFNMAFYENLRANMNYTWWRFSTNGFIGAEYKTSGHYSLSATGNGFPNDSIREITYANDATKKGTSSRSEVKSLSYIANANLAYDQRYVMSANWRRQGNSSFNEYSRWSDFAAIGLSWNIHKEHFIKAPWLNTLRVKWTYGSSGNSRIDSSSAYGSYAINSSHSYGGKSGAALSDPANPGLHWERTLTHDWMIDFAAFNHRIDLSLEFYSRVTRDVLYKGRVSSIITDGSVMRNVGVISNKGIEFTLTTINIRSGDFTWTTSLNGAHNHNMIEELYKDTYSGFFDSIWVAGQSKDAHWLVRYAGVDPVSGAPMWYDKNGDLTYTFSLDNRVYLPEYSKEPILQGGLSNDFQIGRISARIMFDYRIGGWEYHRIYHDGSNVLDTDGNPIVEELDHWTTPGVGNINPQYRYRYGNNVDYNSTRSLWNTSYIQIRSVSLGYRFPERWNRALHVKSCTASIIGDNLYLWTPGQSRTKNSYKTIKYADGMRRGVSFQLSINF